jgi:hypothetical protein
MNKNSSAPDKFSCAMDLPILVGGERGYVPVVAVFRCIPSANSDEWVMSSGQPRSDGDLAAEVLVEVIGVHRGIGNVAPQRFDVPEILEVDRAAALVVATFLSTLTPPEDPAGSGSGRRVRYRRRKFTSRPIALASRTWA